MNQFHRQVRLSALSLAFMAGLSSAPADAARRASSVADATVAVAEPFGNPASVNRAEPAFDAKKIAARRLATSSRLSADNVQRAEPHDSQPAGTPVSLSVSTVGDGSILIDPEQPTYNVGDIVELTAVAASGSLFNGWTEDVTSNDNPLQLMLQQDTSVTANFIAKSRSGTTSTLSGAPNPVRIGANVEVSVEVTADDTAPVGGSVEVTTGTGEACTASFANSSFGNTATYSCILTFATLGHRTINATFAETATHLGSDAAPTQHSVLRFASMSILIDDGRTEFDSGDDVNYLVEVRNAGPDDAFGVVVQVIATPPMGNPEWSCTGVGGAVCPSASGDGDVFDSLTLPIGGGLDFLVVGTLPSESLPPTIEVTAFLYDYADEPHFTHDPDISNNTSTDVNVVVDIFTDSFEPAGE